MAERANSVTLHPIGLVENGFEKTASTGPSEGVPSRIVLFEAFSEGLAGLEPGQQVLVVFWFHRSSGYELQQHPQGDRARPMRGVFTLRSPRRPNPIGISKVTVTDVVGNTISVSDLDAFNGTPVLDIKPAGGPH
jgi:L-fuculose-phosphate aldolase